MMVPIVFRQGWRVYAGGEIAGFDDELAKSLVDAGVANYLVKKEEGETSPPHEENQDEHKDALTRTKFERMNADQLIELAKEKNIDIGDKTLKKDVKPIIKAVLFPDED